MNKIRKVALFKHLDFDDVEVVFSEQNSVSRDYVRISKYVEVDFPLLETETTETE